jgi:thymidine phosphorylase
MLDKQLASGAALAKFYEMIEAQGGKPDCPLPWARHQRPIAAPRSGTIQSIACDDLGYAVIALGGGRKAAGEKIDPSVGFEHPRKTGEQVTAGEPLMTMHYNNEAGAEAAERLVKAAYRIGEEPATRHPIVSDRFE